MRTTIRDDVLMKKDKSSKKKRYPSYKGRKTKDGRPYKTTYTLATGRIDVLDTYPGRRVYIRQMLQFTGDRFWVTVNIHWEIISRPR